MTFTPPTPIPLSDAQALAERLCDVWSLDRATWTIVGDVRRQSPVCAKVELVGPKPFPGAADTFHQRLLETINVGEAIFAKPHHIGQSLKGLTAESFNAHCELAIEHGGRQVQVDVYRYLTGDTDPTGDWNPQMTNRGWVEVMRTGNNEFIRHLHYHWKRLNRGEGYSKDGFPHGFVQGTMMRLAVPTERYFFWLNRLIYVEPHMRTGPEAICSVDDSQATADRLTAMKHLGILSFAEVRRRFAELESELVAAA